jgi:hypothetical protein
MQYRSVQVPVSRTVTERVPVQRPASRTGYRNRTRTVTKSYTEQVRHEEVSYGGRRYGFAGPRERYVNVWYSPETRWREVEETYSEPYTYYVNETVYEPQTRTVVDYHTEQQAIGPAPATTWIFKKKERQVSRLVRTRYNGERVTGDWTATDYTQTNGDWVPTGWPAGRAERMTERSVPK